MWSKYKGGVFSALHTLTQSTNDKVTVTQIAETEGDRAVLSEVDLTYHNYPYELLFKGSYKSIPTWERTARLTAKAWSTRCDIVILPGFEKIEYWAMLIILTLRNKPKAVFCDSTINDNPKSYIKYFAKRIFFSLCDGFFCYGERSKHYLMAHGASAEKIYFRRQAAALPHDYTEQKAAHQRIKNAPKQSETQVFVYAGRLSKEKGLDTLLCAMKLVVKTLPSVKLKIIGAGPLRRSLEELSQQLGLSDHVNFPGSMDIRELVIEYSKATAFVLPSTSEPWGLVVNEAMHQGCPCIVSDACGCVPELVIEGETGFSFKTGDANHLAEKMIAATKEFGNIKKTSQSCIEHMRNFVPEKTAKQIIEGCHLIHQKSQK